jgi:ADP-heptose:LPS heptosyltransferase
MKKTFIHHDGALGDLLLSIPAILHLRGQGVFVHLASRADVVAMLKETGIIDEGSAVGGPLYLSLYGGSPNRELIDFLSRFESSLVFTAKAESAAATGIASMIPDTRVILTIPPVGSAVHVSDFRLGQMGVKQAVTPAIPVSSKRMEDAREFLRKSGYDFHRPLIAVHTGSGGKRKCWPLGNYFTLFSQLLTVGKPYLLLLSGPAEGESIVECLKEFIRNHPTDAMHLENPDLPSLAALLAVSNLYIGNDSGVSHLAGSLGVRSIVLFGPTDPVMWRPLGGKVTALCSGSQCSPCGDERSRGCPERICLEMITPDMVAGVVREVLTGSLH